MTMWLVIMYVTLMITGSSLLYLSNRVSKFRIFKVSEEKKKNRFVPSAFVVFLIFGLIGLAINFINAVVCAIYFALIWLVSDAVFFVVEKIRHKPFEKYFAGMFAIVASIAALSCGWYLNHNVWQTTYVIETDKNVKDMKIIMFADSHMGTTFRAEGFARHIAAMQAQNPDMVIVAGDFVDDDTNRADMIATSKALGEMKTTYGVYFVFGNHDKGYYGPAHRGFSGQELVAELEKNGVHVLTDETELVDDMFYVIGRRDFSVEKEQGGKRKSMSELVKNLDQSKYMIVADHQPTDYKNQAAAKVDLVLSGHTHGGQLFPFNSVGKWIGANDRVYGHEKRDDTNFIVTSGLSDWAIKFKTGCKSEYVTVLVKATKK
ncbi:MAG: metallophosphoesterase [Alphaproteobacteria bacterium]|nr:metallophosphoesterase [Alphaproteobacteria bacterium]